MRASSVATSASCFARSAAARSASFRFVFAGSLYALAITGVTVLGAITPLGGLLLLAAWALVALEGVGPSTKS